MGASIVNRYESNKTKVYNKKTIYRSVIYPMIPNRISDIYIIPNENDRLDLLAYKYYGDVRYWWILAQANHLGKGSMAVKPGVRLRVPMDKQSIMSDFESLNELR